MTCKLCNDTGEQRYWEGRWRLEKAINDDLLEALLLLKETIGVCTVDQEMLAWGKATDAIAKATQRS
jgi:hypothetical protein